VWLFSHFDLAILAAVLATSGGTTRGAVKAGP
jgi:hypothetical protein